MTIRTIGELSEEYGKRTAEIMSSYRNELAALRDVELEEGMYLDALDDAQRMRLLREERERRAAEIHNRARAEYVEAAERYREQVEARRGGLQAVLFGALEGAEGAAALASVATSTDQGLERIFEAATFTGSAVLARAAFAEAARRGSMPELVMAFLDSVGEEDRDLYREWLAVPSPEDLQKHVDNVDVLITPADLESFLPQRVIANRTK